MAQKVHVQLIDDLDGSDAVETVKFSIDDDAYEIDASAANAGFLRGALADYVAHARLVGRATTTARRGRPRSAPSDKAPRADREQLRAIRDWAERAGYPVAKRGRIKASTVEAFRAAHAGVTHPAAGHARELVGAGV